MLFGSFHLKPYHLDLRNDIRYNTFQKVNNNSAG